MVRRTVHTRLPKKIPKKFKGAKRKFTNPRSTFTNSIFQFGPRFSREKILKSVFDFLADTALNANSVKIWGMDRDRGMDHKTTFARLGQIDLLSQFSPSAVRHEFPSSLGAMLVEAT